MFNKVHSLFKNLLEGEDLANRAKSEPKLAMAALLCEVSKADHNLSQQEIQAEINILQSLLDFTADEAETLIKRAQERTEQSVSLYDFTSQLRELTQAERFNLIKSMWIIAFTDGVITPIEESVIRKVAELIYLDHSEFIRAKLTAQNE